MAKRKPGPHLIIANRLTDGCAVFLAPDSNWHESPFKAFCGEGDALEEMLTVAARAHENNLVVDPVAVPGDPQNGPTHIKQKMQVLGPSVRPDLGYQAGKSDQPRNS